MGTARAFAMAVADNADQAGLPAASVDVITDTYERLVERRALTEAVTVGYSDVDGDNTADAGELTFSQAAITVCIHLPETAATPSKVTSGYCDTRATVTVTSNTVAETEPSATPTTPAAPTAPAPTDTTGTSTEAAPAPTFEPGSVLDEAQSEVQRTADNANVYTADDFARLLKAQALLDNADPAGVELLETVAATQAMVVLTYSDTTPADGIADERKVTMSANGSDYCLNIASATNIIATFGPC